MNTPSSPQQQASASTSKPEASTTTAPSVNTETSATPEPSAATESPVKPEPSVNTETSKAQASSKNANNSEPSPDMSAGSAGVGIAKSEILTYKTKVETWNLRFKIASFFIVIFLACSFLIVGLCSSTSAIKHIQQIQTSQMDVIKAKVADSNNVKVASTGTNVPLIPKANAAESVDNVADTSEVKNKTDVKAENNEKNTTEIKQSEKSSTQPKTSDKSEEPKTSQKVKEKKLNSDDTFSLTMVSTGSIITLIAFILGVGLTMILTLFKFTFSPPEDASNSKDPAVTLAGPLSELIRSISDYLVKKFKLN